MPTNTGHKAFDAQNLVIARGNIYQTGQLGCLIRAYNTLTNPVNQIVQPGEMQRFDLSWHKLPSHVLAFVKQAALTQDVWLYEFFHYGRRSKRHCRLCSSTTEYVRVSHGFVVTSREHKLLGQFVTGPTSKSADVISFAVGKLTN